MDFIEDHKIEEARALLDQLYDRIDDEGLTSGQQSLFDVLSWLLDGTGKPEID